MLDTIKLQLVDYDVSGANLELERGQVNTLTGEVSNEYPLYQAGEDWVLGKYVKQDSSVFHFRLSCKRQGKASIETPYATVNFEVPRVANGHNFFPATVEETHAAFSSAQSWLTANGIKTNLQSARLVRVDTNRNIVTSQPFSQYSEVLRGLRGKRLEPVNYPDGMMWKNCNRQIVAYDKYLQMFKKKKNVDGLPKDTGRFELKTENRRSIEKALGFDTLSELLKNLDVLAPVYKKSMEDLIFRYGSKDIELFLMNDIEADLRAIKASGSKFWLREYLMTVGMMTVLERVTLDNFGEVVGKVADSRSTKTKTLNTLDELKHNMQRMEKPKGKRATNGQLYQELREKVLA